MNKLYILLLYCIILCKANGQPGSLDPTFGKDGIQTTAFFNDLNLLQERARVVLTGASGDIFVATWVRGINEITRIVKYLPDGRLDSSYSIAGYSDAANLNVAGAVFQGDKIILAGSRNYDFVLARYTKDGVLDSSFGVNGMVTTDFDNASEDIATSITLQGDKILVAGYTGDYPYNFAIARYAADGVPDPSLFKQNI